MNSLDEFEVYDQLLVEPLANKGWSVEMVSWRADQTDWNRFEAVIIRSPWDYQQDADRFMDVLKKIDQSRARLENPLSVVQWNIDKTYLKDLKEKGILIVPTIWGSNPNPENINKAFTQLKAPEIIIKPTVSANADDTFRLKPEFGVAIESILERFSGRNYMIQPFMNSVVSEGEFSLFYFGGEYSHSILKTPKKDDFRVQEEHGGILASVEPEEKLLERSSLVMEKIKPEPLYARADFVRTEDNDFALMELELIEPSLYFNMDPDSPERFARIFDRWMKKNQKIVN